MSIVKKIYIFTLVILFIILFVLLLFDNSQIGNLIPLEESLNRRCDTKPLSEKYVIYSESNFASARGVSALYVDKEFKASLTR